MKNEIILLIVMLSSSICFGQNTIDPPNAFLSDTALFRYKNTIVAPDAGFVRGWNWGRPGAAIDSALGMKVCTVD